MTEETQGGQEDMYVPMTVDHVSGSDSEEEEWEDVDEDRGVNVLQFCDDHKRL